MDTALIIPDRVLGIVVVAGIAHGLELNEEDYEEPFQWETYVKAYKAGDIEALNELEVQMFIDGYNQPVGRADKSIREKVRAMNLVALTNEANAPETTQTVLEPKAATRLNELTMPVLLITSNLDEPVTWEAAEKMLSRMPNAQHIMMEDVAHVPNMEDPETFNHIVSTFIIDIKNG
jgi:pimeloyl-ACP methyl ester carboxylesterase